MTYDGVVIVFNWINKFFLNFSVLMVKIGRHNLHKQYLFEISNIWKYEAVLKVTKWEL